MKSKIVKRLIGFLSVFCVYMFVAQNFWNPFFVLLLTLLYGVLRWSIAVNGKVVFANKIWLYSSKVFLFLLALVVFSGASSINGTLERATGNYFLALPFLLIGLVTSIEICFQHKFLLLRDGNNFVSLDDLTAVEQTKEASSIFIHKKVMLIVLTISFLLAGFFYITFVKSDKSFQVTSCDFFSTDSAVKQEDDVESLKITSDSIKMNVISKQGERRVESIDLKISKACVIQHDGSFECHGVKDFSDEKFKVERTVSFNGKDKLTIEKIKRLYSGKAVSGAFYTCYGR